MKKQLFFIITLFFHYEITRAQTVQWLNTINYSANNSTSGIRTDSFGNVYTSGSYSRFQGDFTSPPGIFISKTDSLGNLIWLDTISIWGAGSRGIVVDKIGNSFMTVMCNSSASITFGGSTYTNTNGVANMYLVKYNTSGNVVWTKKVSNANPTGIYIDDQKIIYVFGRAQDTTHFGQYSTGVNGNFIAKYDSAGNCIQAWSTGYSISNVAIDGNGNMFILDCPSNFASNRLIKYNSLGVLQWMKNSIAGNMIIDKNGNCYLRGGFYSASITLGTTTLTNPYYGSSGISMQFFIAKTDPNGNYLWAFTPSDSVSVLGFHLSNSNIYLTGSSGFQSGGTTGGLYVLKYDTNGFFVSQYDFMNGYAGRCITTEGSNIYLTGELWGGGINFITKISENNTTTNIKDIESDANLHIYPNPTQGFFQIEYVSLIKGKLQINITDANGKIVYTQAVTKFDGDFKKQIDLSREAKGVYFVEIIADKKREVKKVVLE